jgi:acyl-coenzyme A thioesterase PaaI-like protein
MSLPPCSRTLGWKLLEALPGSGKATVQFEAGPQFANPLGQVQGGFLAAMLDDTPARRWRPSSSRISSRRR